jgi:hypothetical protein
MAKVIVLGGGICAMRFGSSEGTIGRALPRSSTQ